MLRPPLMHSSRLTLFMTEALTGVQMFPSLICLRHVRLKRGAAVSILVSEYLRNLHSLLSCVVETIMSAETLVSTPPTSERICVLHLHDMPHFSIRERTLHHFLKTAQRLHLLNGKNRGLRFTAVTRLYYEIRYISSDGMRHCWKGECNFFTHPSQIS